MTNKEKFLEICRSTIRRDGINNLLEWLETSDFFIAPASTKYHGNYEGGLCEHSLNVYEQLRFLNQHFQTNYSDETIAIVALFHDLCKVNFYKKGKRNVKVDGVWEEVTVYEIDERVPLGHGEKSCIILQWYMKLSVDELLAVRWHMGAYDTAFKGGDYGLSRAQDSSKLVSMLNIADLIATNLLEEKTNGVA